VRLVPEDVIANFPLDIKYFLMKNIIVLAGFLILNTSVTHAAFVVEFKPISQNGGFFIDAYDGEHNQLPPEENLLKESAEQMLSQPTNLLGLGVQTRQYMTNFDYPTAQEILRVFSLQSKENPTFLLDECRVIKCSLTRRPGVLSFRDFFREELSKHVMKPADHEGIDIIFYASGAMFYEASIALSLIKKDLAIKTITLIEPKWGEVFKKLIPQLGEKITIKDIQALWESEGSAKAKTLLEDVYRLKQFLDLIEANNGQRPDLYIYTNANHLVKDINSEEKTPADALIGFDFVDLTNSLSQAKEDIAGIYRTIKIGGILATAFCEEGIIYSTIAKKNSAGNADILFTRPVRPSGF
jgi:hypothetical protein